MYNSLSQVKKINVKKKKLLIPNMHPYGAQLLAACFRAYDVDAHVMDTYKGLNLGKEFTSSKECFPCQVTLGDVLYYLKKEKKRLRDKFKCDKYVYFMPESDGPCRFGMYNKLHRIVFDTLPEFKDIAVSYLTTEDSYDTRGILPHNEAKYFRQLAYVATITADVLDRIAWRVRPYEIKKGETDKIILMGLWELITLIEQKGKQLPFNEIYEIVSLIAKKASKIINPKIPRKPQIGIVGEIYLRSHPPSNQNLILKIEQYGGEVTNASLGEWINYITFEYIRKTKMDIEKDILTKTCKMLFSHVKSLLAKKIEITYQKIKQKKVYDAALKYLDIKIDHDIETLQKKLKNDSIYSFEVGTEACLSISGALSYIEENFHGIVNVYPFTCMPSTITSAVLKPILRKRHIPYIDTPYDGTIYPNREISLRTFMYQAHLKQKGEKEVIY